MCLCSVSEEMNHFQCSWRWWKTISTSCILIWTEVWYVKTAMAHLRYGPVLTTTLATSDGSTVILHNPVIRIQAHGEDGDFSEWLCIYGHSCRSMFRKSTCNETDGALQREIQSNLFITWSYGGINICEIHPWVFIFTWHCLTTRGKMSLVHSWCLATDASGQTPLKRA